MKFIFIYLIANALLFLQGGEVSLIKIFETFGFPVALSIVLIFLLTRSEKQKMEMMQKNAERQIELMEKNNEYLKSLIANIKCQYK